MKKLSILLSFSLFFSLFFSQIYSQNVGIDQVSPANKVDINGNLSVGSAYSGSTAAPANGAIIQGSVGIGLSAPDTRLHVSGADNDGTVATLKITSGSQNMLLDGNEIDVTDAGGLYLQNNVATDLILLNGGGSLAVRHNSPDGDIHLLQSDGLMAGRGGMIFEANNKQWKAYNSFSHLSFAEDGVRRAYIEAGTGDWTQPSDRRVKEEIEYLGNVLNGVLQLKPARYRYIGSGHNHKTLGFIAQEVQEVFPEIVRTSEEGQLALGYKDFGILAIKAIQEQQEIIQSQT